MPPQPHARPASGRGGRSDPFKMAFKATLSVLFGGNFAQANKLLAAAERGEEQVVQQVLRDNPQLAAYAGFHGTSTPLIRAAAAGHLEVCRSIVEPIKQRIRLAEQQAASAPPSSTAGRRAIAAAAKWHKLLATVLNQRSHKSLTPLMLACERGHATVVAYLLREGADPLVVDFAHSRSCLHYAAIGGHADCLRLLCSDATVVPGKEGARPLREVIVSDPQVQTCRFIDQRAFGGLTALHFAVVTGNLEAVQALLRAGSSIMVKSDGEAYIGEDFLVPGSTPLHVAVIIQNLSIVHAILQAHMEMMNILGTTLDERGRRPWEGTSRTDIRSVRNHFRKLPFHLARERQHPQLMSLVDPRIPIDVALDAARDTEHGIGPKRLSTIVSLVLQRSLLQWLDNCQGELAREAAARQQRLSGSGAPAAPADQLLSGGRQQSTIHAALAVMTGRQRSSKPPKAAKSSTSAGTEQATSAPNSPPGTAGSGLVAETVPQMAAATVAAAANMDGAQASAAPAEAGSTGAGEEAEVHTPRAAAVAASGPDVSPFAAAAAAGGRPSAGLHISASAPVTPARGLSLAGQSSMPPATEGAVPSLDMAAAVAAAQQQQGNGPLQSMASLHAYMGMLSIKRQGSRGIDGTSAAATAAASAAAGGRAVSRHLSAQAGLPQLARGSATTAQTARVRFLSDPSAPLDAAGGGSDGSAPSSPRELQPLPNMLSADVDRTTITVRPQHRRISSQGTTASVRGVLGGLRERLRSTDPTTSPQVDAAVGAALALSGEKQSEKDVGMESEGEAPSPSSHSEGDGEDVECGVCLDHVVEVAFAACHHKLCLECARNLTRQNKKPPQCPFCRRMVVGFERVSCTGVLLTAHGH